MNAFKKYHSWLTLLTLYLSGSTKILKRHKQPVWFENDLNTGLIVATSSSKPQKPFVRKSSTLLTARKLFPARSMAHPVLVTCKLQEHSCCPTGWYISPIPAPTHLSGTPESTLPPSRPYYVCLGSSHARPELPSSNITWLFSTAATQPLTASDHTRINSIFELVFSAAPWRRGSNSPRPPVCRRPLQPYGLPCPPAPCRRSLTSPKENTRNKNI